MNLHARAAAAAALFALASTSMTALAQETTVSQALKAPHTATPVKAAAVAPAAVAPVATKAPVINTVTPAPAAPGTQSGIIFVGGKPQNGTNAALNPQPIPPGRNWNVAPLQRGSQVQLNPQPIPPGHPGVVTPPQ